jgi:hypothetical protein
MTRRSIPAGTPGDFPESRLALSFER